MSEKSSVSFRRVTCEAGDWEGLYVDGSLTREGHSLDGADVLDELRQLPGGVHVVVLPSMEIPDDLMEEFGSRMPSQVHEFVSRMRSLGRVIAGAQEVTDGF